MGLSKYRMNLLIEHVPTGYTVEFPAFLEMFSDAYTQQWNAEDVYGRMDPIATFVNTRRALSLAWNVPAESYKSAQQNLQKVNTLMGFMYPLYEDEGVGGATAINQAPLLRISFGNLIRNAKTGAGLLGYVQGFTFDPALEFGMFYSEGRTSAYPPVPGTPNVEYYPKTFRLNTEFNVLHEHSPGFQRASSNGKSFSYRSKGVDNSTYPYGSGLAPTINEMTKRGESKPQAVVPPVQIPTPIPTVDASQPAGGLVPFAEFGDAVPSQGTPIPAGESVIKPKPKSPAEADPGSPQNNVGGSGIAVMTDGLT
tara:strand:- start:4991 stop:5920 length:930 start_codon:yes stop_codon:yes gene_type:complete